MGSIGCEQSPNQYCALSLEPNHTRSNAQWQNGSQMVKMNITIELDSNDISLTDLLSAILHKEHVPVEIVPVETVAKATVKQEEEKPAKVSKKKSKTTESKKKLKTPSPVLPETVEAPVKEVKKAVSAPSKTPTALRGRPRINAPRKKTKANRRPELRDIGGLVNKDRVALLKASKFNTVRRFALAHPDNLMLVMGCSLNEIGALENAQRVASAMHRKYSMKSSIVTKTVEKKIEKKPKWNDEKIFATVWNGIEGRDAGAYMLSDVVEKALNMANQNYDGVPKPKKFSKQLYETGRDLFAKIVEVANSPSFSILGTGEYTALLVLSPKGWPTLRDIEA